MLQKHDRKFDIASDILNNDASFAMASKNNQSCYRFVKKEIQNGGGIVDIFDSHIA